MSLHLGGTLQIWRMKIESLFWRLKMEMGWREWILQNKVLVLKYRRVGVARIVHIKYGVHQKIY